MNYQYCQNSRIILDQTPRDLDIEDILVYFQTIWIQGLTTSSGTGEPNFTRHLLAHQLPYEPDEQLGGVLQTEFSALLGHTKPTI